MLSNTKKTNNTKRIILIFLSILYLFLSSFTDDYGNIIEINANASKTTVGVGENFYLTININFQSPTNTQWYVEDQFKVSKIEEFLNNFTVISRSVERKITQTNDYDIMDLNYTYLLQAKQEGEFTLKDIGLMYNIIDGNNKINKYSPMSGSLTIKVVKMYPNQPYPNQPYPNQPNPNQPYPNQPYPNQPNPNQPYPNQPYPNQPYPNQPNPNQPYPNQPQPNFPNPPNQNPQTTFPSINPPQQPQEEELQNNIARIATIALLSIIGITIIGIGIYWLYKLLTTPNKTIQKEQNTQENIINADKFSSPTEKPIEKIAPIDFSNFNFSSKLRDVEKEVKLKNYNKALEGLLIVSQYLIYKTKKTLNEDTFRNSLEKLKQLKQTELHSLMNDTYKELIEISYYQEDLKEDLSSENYLSEKINQIIEKLKSIENMVNKIKT